VTSIWLDIILRHTVTGETRPFQLPQLPAGFSYHPNIPNGIRWFGGDGLPTDFVAGDCRPATSLFNVRVDEKDIPAISAHLAKQGKKVVYTPDAPERDVLMIEMAKACPVGRVEESKADAFFDSIDMAEGDAAKRQAVADCIAQAQARGLLAAKAMEIAERLDVADVELTARREA